MSINPYNHPIEETDFQWSQTNLEHKQLITCNLCQRRYNADVYERHISESQCVKRNQQRLPFESIKQRSIQIGDKVFSVQQQVQQKNKEGPLSNNRENEKQQVFGKNKQLQEKMPKIVPSQNRRRTLEQAKRLLERRTKYKPPWMQKRPSPTSYPSSQLNRTNTITLPPRDVCNHALTSTTQTKTPVQKVNYHIQRSPPSTKFKNDNVLLRISDRRASNYPVARQPVPTHSPKISTSRTSIYPSHRIDQSFLHGQPDSAPRSTRQVSTWTRPLPLSTARHVISPIQIPTFQNSSCGPSYDQISLPFNQNYEDDGDEFERYSPTPPSTPKFQREKTETKTCLTSVKQTSVADEQQITIRPVTYQRAKRSEPSRENDILPVCRSNLTPRKHTQLPFHLPPIKPTSYLKVKRSPTINLTPWR